MGLHCAFLRVGVAVGNDNHVDPRGDLGAAAVNGVDVRITVFLRPMYRSGSHYLRPVSRCLKVGPDREVAVTDVSGSPVEFFRKQVERAQRDSFRPPVTFGIIGRFDPVEPLEFGQFHGNGVPVDPRRVTFHVGVCPRGMEEADAPERHSFGEGLPGRAEENHLQLGRFFRGRYGPGGLKRRRERTIFRREKEEGTAFRMYVKRQDQRPLGIYSCFSRDPLGRDLRSGRGNAQAERQQDDRQSFIRHLDTSWKTAPACHRSPYQSKQEIPGLNYRNTFPSRSRA